MSIATIVTLIVTVGPVVIGLGSLGVKLYALLATDLEEKKRQQLLDVAAAAASFAEEQTALNGVTNSATKMAIAVDMASSQLPNVSKEEIMDAVTSTLPGLGLGKAVKLLDE